ncbi:3-oxoacyl-[acyl-carrier-protein] reductase FabG1 [Stieleria bergensis]|uniref:3-oxoacyl-[acyl-carrier-protein] reductase FabG1 n=1 Tax=Stieleria bergensis TaxID=2528025 RepID=A0A517SQ23_9BACT|nr:MAG: oxidoreductase [Rhodopirellula sp. TMED11]QDT58218.1 3-oxoacyl-[acyl-carrier-protein] reductase FabG1 [Planctomycetes bacterium SV_7m_r]
MTVKNFVVIGGSYGIGAGIVARLAQQQHRVDLLSRTNEADDCADSANIHFHRFDALSDDINPDWLPDEIHGLVYCPGSINLGPLRGLKPAAMMQDYQLNVIGAVKCLQACLKPLKAAKDASVLMFSTVAVSQGLAMHASVAAAKGAVEGLTRALAAELAPKIRVNCIAPSLVDTPLAESLLSTEQKREALSQRHPLKRLGTVDDIASLAAFLLSSDATWITGQVVGVDGGLSRVRS